MSDYEEVAIHPKTGVRQIAVMVDDYYGHHIYGVQFPDRTVWPVNEVKRVSAVELFNEIQRLSKASLGEVIMGLDKIERDGASVD